MKKMLLLCGFILATGCTKKDGNLSSLLNPTAPSIIFPKLAAFQNLTLDNTLVNSVNAAQAIDLGVVSQNQSNKKKVYIVNSLSQAVNLSFDDLNAKLAGQSRYTLSNNECGVKLKAGLTCSFDITLNYVASNEDYTQPIIANVLLPNQFSNAEIGNLIFTGAKNGDISATLPLANVLKTSTIAENYILSPSNTKVSKRFYLANISDSNVQAPSVNAPDSGTITANNCDGSLLRKYATCYFDVSYNYDNSKIGSPIDTSISFSSTSPLFDATNFKIAISVNNQPAVIPVVNTQIFQTTIPSTVNDPNKIIRIYVVNLGNEKIDPTQISIPSPLQITNTSCNNVLKPTITCFYEVKIDTSKTSTVAGIEVPINIAGSPAIVRAGNVNCPANVMAVNFSNDGSNVGKINISGSSLSCVTSLKIKKNNVIYNAHLDAANPNSIVATLEQGLSLATSQALQLIIGNAYGDQTLDVSFSIADHSITINKLSGALSGTGVSKGQILKWDGSQWIPSSMTTGQNYIGVYSPATNVPDLSQATTSLQAGDYFIATDAGSIDLGSGSPTAIAAGDWIVYNGTSFDKLANSSVISSFNGRKGLVVPMAGDYGWSDLKKDSNSKVKDSKLNDLADIDVQGVTANQYLAYDASSQKWKPATLPAVDLSSREPSLPSGTSSQYFKGDKTLGTLNTDAVAEANNKYFTDLRASNAVMSNYVMGPNVVLTNTDSIVGAFGKLQAQTTGILATMANTTSTFNSSLQSKADLTNTTQVITANAVTGLLDPTTDYEAANKHYVDSLIQGYEPKITAGSSAQYIKGDKSLGTLNTDAVVEGTNLYFTNPRSIGAVLTGLNPSLSGNIAATDSVLIGFGKTQSQLSTLSASVSTINGQIAGKEPAITAGSTAQYIRGDKTLGTFASDVLSTIASGINTSLSGTISAADSVLSALGKAQNQINTLTTSVGGKEPAIAVGTSAQYFKGDKTWATLNTDAVVEGSAQYFTAARVLSTVLSGINTSLTGAISGTDSVLVAFGKVQNQLNSKLSSASFIDWSVSGLQTIDPSRLSLGASSPSKAVVTNASGAIVASATSATEIGYVAGVTSAIQSQLDSKEPAITAGTTAQYLRGNKTLSTFATDVINSVLTGFTAGNTASTVLATDSVLAGMQKLQGSLNEIQLGSHSYASNAANQMVVGASGTSSTTDSKVKVYGTITTPPVSQVGTGTTNTVDFRKSNVIYCTATCSGTWALNYLADGGSYTLIFQDSGTYTIGTMTATKEDGSTAATVVTNPAFAARTSGKDAVFNLVRVGSKVYITWAEF